MRWFELSRTVGGGSGRCARARSVSDCDASCPETQFTRDDGVVVGRKAHLKIRECTEKVETSFGGMTWHCSLAQPRGF